MVKFVVNKFDSDQTLEKYIKKALKNAPLSFIYKLFRKKDIKVNGKRENEKLVLKENDEILVYITDQQAAEFINDKPLEGKDEISSMIIYEDEDVLILNKPRNLLVQKDSTNSKSLDVMVKEYMIFKGCNNSFLASPVHRIDRNTSGIVIFGKSNKVTSYLATVIKEHKLVKKTYLTLVKGKVEGSGEINAPLLKNEKLNKVFPSKVEDGGKTAITQYETIFSNDEYSYLKVNLLTGRSHQIRAHFAYINHPVIGDEKYGDFEENKKFKSEYNFSNQFLHAKEVSFSKLDSVCGNLSNKSFVAEMPVEEKNILKLISGGKL